jgi:nucleotide-binding universal stress UspA family protein
MFDKILLATDGSDGALHATGQAAEIAKKFGSKITVVYVCVPPMPVTTMVDMPGIDIDPTYVSRYMEETGNAVARRTGKVLEEAGVNYELRTEIGHPAESIINVATEGRYNLIVIGSRGLSGIRSFFLGSVSDRVAHLAHCPVLIVR